MSEIEVTADGSGLVPVDVEIPTRIWRVQYVVRTVDSRSGHEEHDEQMQVVWFETEEGLQDFVAKAWMSQQDSDFYREEVIVHRVHRVLVETSAEVVLDVGVKVSVTCD